MLKRIMKNVGALRNDNKSSTRLLVFLLLQQKIIISGSEILIKQVLVLIGEKLKIITKTWLAQKISGCPSHPPSPKDDKSLLELASRCLKLKSPISVINLIRILELPAPEIEFLRAEPMNVNPNSQSKLSWRVNNCENVCSISISKQQPGISETIATGLQSQGTFTVTVPSKTDYTLKAEFPTKHTAEKTVSVNTLTVAGVSSIRVTNSHSENLSVFVWIRDTSTTNWQDKGILEFGKSITIPLQDQHAFELVCVDPTLPVCSGNHPDEGPCRKLDQFALGASNGPILNLQVF